MEVGARTEWCLAAEKGTGERKAMAVWYAEKGGHTIIERGLTIEQALLRSGTKGKKKR